jgi:hypothetical protein
MGIFSGSTPSNLNTCGGMMKKLGVILAAMLIAGMLPSPSAWAEAEWKVLQTVKPEHPPIDLVISSNRKQVYVLDDLGWISIYTIDGQLKDKIQVGTDVRQIKAGPSDGTLFLLSRTAGTFQVVSIDIIENIDAGNSPIKGRPDAPVSIVVFSDFQ